MRNVVVDLDRAKLEADEPRGLLDAEVRLLGRVDDSARLPRARRGERGDRRGRRRVLDVPVPAARQAEQLREPVQHRHLELGRGRGREPGHVVDVQRRDQELGEDPRLGAGVGEPREEARVVPVREPRQDQLVEVAQERLERLALLGRRRRAAAARTAPGSTRAATGSSPTRCEVRVDPVGGQVEVVAERHRLLPQLLDLLPRARVQHVVLRQPRAARLADAELDVVERGDLVAVGVDHDLQARLAGGARVHVAQVEPVGLRVHLDERPVSSAFSITRSRSIGDGGRLPILRPVGWPMQSTYGLSIAARIRSVGLWSNRECDEATTQSRVARSASSTSSVPSGRMLTSMPLRMRNGATTLVQRVDRLRLPAQQVAAQPLRVIADRVVRVPARLRSRDHVLERVLAVGPRRVRVQIAAQVRQLDELRQRARRAPRRARRRPRAAQAGSSRSRGSVDVLLTREVVLLARSRPR